MKDSAAAVYQAEPESAHVREEDVPRGYRRTEVGVIPQDWAIESLAEISSPVRGASPRPAGDPRFFDGNFIPWLTVAALTNIPDSQLVVTQTATYLTEAGASFSRELAAGTLIIANSGATLGVAKVLGINCCANDGIAALLRLKRTVCATYLARLINSKTDYLREAVATGNGQPNLNTDLIGNIKLPFPPTRKEQEAIAETLGDADALIESLQQFIAKKRAIKQGAMQALLTGRQRLPGFTDEWQTNRLDELFTFSGGFSASRDQLGAQGHCYLHYGDIHTSNRSFIDVGSEAANIPKLDVALSHVPRDSMLDDGDVVFVDASEDEDGASKHVVVSNPDGIPFISGLHTIVAKAKTDDLVHAYRRYCFQTDAVRTQFRFFAVGTKVLGVSKGNIGKIELCFPPRDEQTAVAAVLSDMDAEIEALKARLAKTRALKTGMMQALLTGRTRLVSPAKGSVPTKEKSEPQVAGTASHNKHFNEAVVIGVLARHFGNKTYPLGRFRRTKLAYLLHRHCEGRAGGFMKKAAGPYDPGTRYGGAEAIALKSGYAKKSRKRNKEGFVAGSHIAAAEGYFQKWYGADVLKWLEQFRRTTNEELELLTTVDMAVVELKGVGKRVDVVGVKDILRADKEWQPKLARPIFSDRNIARAIDKCKDLFEASPADGNGASA